ncbi:hypothetical protein SDC9_139315 [bioreactor metagenome]|uniref:Uncharacterized protein n=1 Tax=bioreactor metagenome TaxID=1076179 RepID=A0A645DRT0_9ZZZZ
MMERGAFAIFQDIDLSTIVPSDQMYPAVRVAVASYVPAPTPVLPDTVHPVPGITPVFSDPS